MADIKSIGPEVNNGLVEALESLLEEAKKGEIQAASIATVNAKGLFMHYWDRGSVSMISLLGATEALKMDITLNGFEW